MFVFFAVALAVLFAIHWYLWKRLVRDPLPPGRARRAGGILMVLLAILVPATLIGTRTGHATWLGWPGYLWIALMFYLLVILAVLEIPRLIVSLTWVRGRSSETGLPVSGARSTAIPAPGAPENTGGTATTTAAGDPSHATTATAGDPSHATTAAAGDPSHATPDAAESGATTHAAESGATTDRAAESATAAGGDTRSGDENRTGIERRLLLARGAAIFAGLTAAGITGYGVRTALGGPQLDRVQIPLAKLPRAMDGTRLAVVSDIHLGPLTGPDHARRIVDLINSVDADVVCIVGDMVDGTVEELGRLAAPLADIRARQGAYFVTGNHEYYSGFQQWVDEVARLGVRPLRNERLQITTRGGTFDLAGVNDPGGAEFDDAPDFERALGDRDPARPVVLMAHQPVVARDAARYGVDLQVSGHTHGGQMMPFNLLVRLEQPVVSGFGKVDGVPVYVTNGAGFWGPPVRVGAPPQVSLIELRTP
ncbi:metallophosphoesterase [Jidongwangia harbinensis]|uniref:metallophosphoesterase n=1 Tax=Jidongwangia harbinensis TaxID=2878561 RepID=UPI001CD9E108|nr:metallophosphoesterase [Jidongwangia harbinensis]MCA2212682.1 metallophosphoesterase [Jidongwangia harbinensis]